jgi:hypothetical protein
MNHSCRDLFARSCLAEALLHLSVADRSVMRLVSIILVAALSFGAVGCKRYPPVDLPLLARLLPGQQVPLDRIGAQGGRWTFGAVSPSALAIREVERDGKTARVVLDVHSANVGAEGAMMLADGRLRVSLEWIADTWTVTRIENLTFRAVRTNCGVFLPQGFQPAQWPSVPDNLLLHAIFPAYDPTSHEIAVVAAPPRSAPDVRGLRLCRGGPVRGRVGGQLVVRHRQLLADGRIALFIQTLPPEADCRQGCAEEGVVGIFSQVDQVAVVDALVPWSNSRLVPEPAFEEGQIGSRHVLVERCPREGTNGPDIDGRCIWVEDNGELAVAGTVLTDLREDLSCEPQTNDEGLPTDQATPPWIRTRRSTLVFGGPHLVVRDDVTYERGACAAATVRMLAPVHHTLERHFVLTGRQLQEIDHREDAPPVVP